MLSRSRAGCIAAAVAVVSVAGAATAWADVGVGVGAQPIRLKTEAVRGHAYALPSFLVANTGSQASQYHVRVAAVTRAMARHRAIAPSWITFERNDVPLSPKQSTMIPMRLQVPAGASPGLYAANIIASTSGAQWTGQNGVGAGAATELSFVVVRHGAGNEWLVPLPWVAFYALLVVTIVVVLFFGPLRRRKPVLPVERAVVRR